MLLVRRCDSEGSRHGKAWSRGLENVREGRISEGFLNFPDYLRIGGDFAQETVGVVLVVDTAAEVLHTVAYDKPIDMKSHVVTRYLVECPLCDFNLGCLILYDK